MEWIIGIIFLFILGSIFGKKENNNFKTSDKSSYKLPEQSTSSNKAKKENEQKLITDDKLKEIELNRLNLDKTQFTQKIPEISSKEEEIELNIFLNEIDSKSDTTLPYKEEWNQIKDIVIKNKINKLYHFTDKANISSIKKMGGLFSWQELEKLKVHIPAQGGNDLSKKLDISKNLQDYVRLSFVENTPMLYFAKEDGRINDPLILEIDPSVIFLKDTMYSDGNATSNQSQIGGDLKSFKKINFDVIKQKRWDGEEQKHYWQAEVMVKKNIPLNFIKNI